MPTKDINATDIGAPDSPNAADLLSSVARAVSLQEGEAGVRDVLRAIRQVSPASTRAVSRATGLPVPVVAAVSNELRARGVLTTQRPARLTERGQRLAADLGLLASVPGACECCAGRTVIIPTRLEPVVERLAAAMAELPDVDLSLDQSYSTAETKVRRVVFLLNAGVLPAGRLLLVGDDDLMSLTVVEVGAALGVPLVTELAVVEVSAPILDFLSGRLAGAGGPDSAGGHYGAGGPYGADRPRVAAELVQHDLREPLPPGLCGRFDAAVTDPPYTPEGAGLFLSRAVEGLRPGPGRSVLFSFGAKGPQESLQVQRAATDLGLAIQAMHRGFNEYLGAGILAGTSHLMHLATTEETKPTIIQGYRGPLYTADKRGGAARRYRCLGCGAEALVGPRERWRTIAELKAAGCPACGVDRLRPLQRSGGDGPA